MSKPFIFNIDYTNNLQNNEHNIYRQRLIKCDFAKILQNKGVLFGVSLDGNKYVHDLHRKNIKGEKTYDSIITNIESIENNMR